MKRIPKSSPLPGINRSRWVRFVSALNDIEADIMGHILHGTSSSHSDLTVYRFVLKLTETFPSLLSSCYTSEYPDIDWPGIQQIAAFGEENEEFPPAPRLVGIETNPGPPRGLVKSLVTDVAQIVGASVAAATKKKKKTTKKKQSTRRRVNDIGMSMTSSLVRSQPSNATSFRRKTIGNDVVRMNFDLLSMPIYSGIGPASTSVPRFGTPNGNIALLDFDPNSAPAGINMFGTLGSVAACFQKFRFTRLKIHYTPCLPVTYGGSLMFATCEAGIANAAQFSFADLTKLASPVVTPGGVGIEIPVTFPMNEWLFVYHGPNNNAEIKLGSAGCLLVGGDLTGGTNNILLGYIRLSGTLEFADLGLPPAQITTVSSRIDEHDTSSLSEEKHQHTETDSDKLLYSELHPNRTRVDERENYYFPSGSSSAQAPFSPRPGEQRPMEAAPSSSVRK